MNLAWTCKVAVGRYCRFATTTGDMKKGVPLQVHRAFLKGNAQEFGSLIRFQDPKEMLANFYL